MQLSIYGFPSTEGLFQTKKQAAPERQLSYDNTPNKYSQAILSEFFKFFQEFSQKISIHRLLKQRSGRQKAFTIY
jgi:hypothetical protein